MAGRCHSATHIAMGGTRVMRPMCATGQAAGTAAAIAREHGTTPRGVYSGHLQQLQQALLKDGCYLMGVKNADPKDLALSSKASASSSAEGLPPAGAINGWNRIVDGNRNAWAPDPKAAAPHWLQLDLAGEQSVSVAHLTFEVNDVACRIEAAAGDAWKTVAEVTPSGARRRVIRFEPVQTGRIRIVMEKVSPLCEVRLYER
jgi:hypothetical protein